mmetsp:Transcript_3500/g.10866  ORF Transcript_3500/g.10866 Transcript_3500/m.10866 type:complete len:134 (+) Transcript_3500:429-830(+)
MKQIGKCQRMANCEHWSAVKLLPFQKKREFLPSCHLGEAMDKPQDELHPTSVRLPGQRRLQPSRMSNRFCRLVRCPQHKSHCLQAAHGCRGMTCCLQVHHLHTRLQKCQAQVDLWLSCIRPMQQNVLRCVALG